MFLLTILAAGSVEPGRTVTKLGGSLPTLAPIEAHTVATHSCTCRCGQTGLQEEEKDREKKLVSEAETPGCCRKMSTSAVSNNDLFLS